MRSPVLALSLLLAFCLGAHAAANAPAAAPQQAAPEHRVTQSESYIMLAPMYATIMDGERPSGTVMVAVGLDIPDEQLRAEATRAMPVLRDAFVRSIMAFTWTHVRIAEQPDVVAIADRLQRIVDRELRSKGARVLLAEVACHATN
jgi:flagellar basal body-associated protein FliL